MNEEEFAENKKALYNEFENMLFDTCYKFQENFMNWNHLQEEFPDEHACEVFLQEIIDEVLEEVGNGGIIL